jgi:hypothetical protein
MLKREQEILDQAIAALKRETNLTVEKMMPETRQVALSLDDDAAVDAIVRIDFPPRAAEFWVKVKPTINNMAMAQTAHRFVDDRARWLLATRYVHPQLAGALRELHIQFIDTAGNAFIEAPPVFIQIQGHRRRVDAAEAREEGMLGRAGLKLAFALMCRPELWTATYRDIAKAARVALGTAAGVMKDLKAQGYLVEYDGQQRRLVRQKELLRKWMTAYAERFRPRNVIGRYRGTRPELWREADLQRLDAQWGGEVAAYRLTHYLKPEVTTIYTRRPNNDLILDLKLRQDKTGDIELRERFWDFQNIEPDPAVVPLLLVYADLMATGDPRNIETAKMIYDEYLQKQLVEA